MAKYTSKCCLNCEERHIGCHSTCKKYIKSIEDYRKEKDKEVKEKIKEANIYKTRNNGIVRMKKRKGNNPSIRSTKK